MNDALMNAGVAIVAPGGYAPDEPPLARGIARLEACGCRVRDFYEPAAKYLRFGASDAQRAAQIHNAAADPGVQIVLALRGGYGMSRIMHLLDFGTLAASGKLFVGSSDFTAFNLGLLAVGGGISFAGPMLCNDFTRDDPSAFTIDHFRACLRGPSHQIVFRAPGSPNMAIEGTLWGGNLSMVTHLVGSRYLPVFEGGILFLEDVNEHPYRVERMMLQLLNAGVLARQAAIVLGAFSAYQLSEYDNGYNFEAMLSFLRDVIPVPLITGLPFGHVRDKATLPVGCGAELTVEDGTARVLMRSYPCLLSPLMQEN